ncbi:MAG: hypothetical protein ACLFUS_17435 [Candidatus Sumerlaeia bacterium]
MKASQAETPITSAHMTAINETKLRKKVFWRHLTSVWTLAPFVVGFTLLAGVWALGIKSGLLIFGGLALLLASAGSYFTQLFLGSEKATKKAIEDLRREAEAQREKALDELDKRLRADGDPRTETNLRDLRVLARAFRDDHSWSEGLSNQTSFDIVNGVNQLFERCVKSLERSLVLYKTARKIRTRAARQNILLQREHIVQDVAKSIEQLGVILGRIHMMQDENDHESSALAQIRDELDRSLDVAQAVEKRIRDLDREIGMESE